MDLKNEDRSSAETIFGAYLLRRDQGRAEPVEEFLANHEEHRAELVRCLHEQRRADRQLASIAPQPPRPNVADYRLVREIGRGGMGVVYEAEQVSSGRRVALKLLPRDPPPRPEHLARFRREGELAGQLRHPRCVFVFSVGEENGLPYIAMELMPGETVQDLVRRNGPLPVAQAVELALQLIEGLEAAAALGIVHRDLKPSNCFLDVDGSVKVGDFGLSKSLWTQSDLTVSGSFIGTPLFASPEQIRGRTLDHRSDQYSLGATLYYMLTGEPPFVSTNAGDLLAAVISDRPRRLRRRGRAIPRGLEKTVLRTLEKEPDRRFRDFEALRRALRPFGPEARASAPLGLRVAAALVDWTLVSSVLTALAEALPAVRDQAPAEDVGDAVALFLFFLYFAVLQGLAGTTLGKSLFGLRLSFEKPYLHPWVAAVIRTSVLFGFVLTPYKAVGVVLVCLSMRRRNGFRGLHELASRTRVVRPQQEVRGVRIDGAPADPSMSGTPAELPARLGPYEVKGRLWSLENGELLQAWDTSLHRAVWLRIRSTDRSAIASARRDLSRPTRLRWLQGGEQNGWRWDAFEPPRSIPAARVLAHRPLSWSEARWHLRSLARELRDATADGTLPSALSVEDVWLSPGGTVQIVDPDLRHEPGSESSVIADPRMLLKSAAVAWMAASSAQTRSGRRAGLSSLALPRQGSELLGSLTRAAGASPSMDVVVEALDELAKKPATVQRGLRAAPVLLGLVLLLGFFRSEAWWPRSPQRAAVLVLTAEGYDQEKPDPYRGPGHSSPDLWMAALTLVAHEDLEGLRRAGVVSTSRAAGEGSDPLLGTEVLSEERAARLVQNVKALTSKWSRDPKEVESAKQTLLDHRPREIRRRFAHLSSILMMGMLVLTTISALVLRGGLILRLVGLEVRQPTGERANRVRCTARAAMTWLPACLLISFSHLLMSVPGEVVRMISSDPGRLLLVLNHVASMLLALSVLWVVVVAVHGMLRPARTLPERLTGTILMPR